MGSARRALITGATGFVGANLVRRLLAEGHEVHALVRPQRAMWRIQTIAPELNLHMVELADREKLTSVVREIRPEWIFHLAAHGAYSWQTDVEAIIQTNVVGTANLIDACLATGFESFVNAGSSSEYGFKDHPPSEYEAIDPNSYYAVGKASATMLCRFTGRSRSLNMPTLRLYSAYGPYEDPGRFIPSLITRAFRGELPLLVDPQVARDFIHVEDVVDAFLLAAERPAVEFGAIYNVCTGVQTTIQQVVDLVRAELDVKLTPMWGSMPNRQWDTSVWVGDGSRMRDDLGWRARYSLEAGLLLTVKWFRETPGVADYYASQRG